MLPDNNLRLQSVPNIPKLTKPDRAAPAAKRVQNPCGLQQSSISVCGQLQLEQGRESLVKYAQQEKIAEDGEHQTLASSPGLTVIRTLGTLSPKLPKGPKPPKTLLPLTKTDPCARRSQN